MQQNCHDDHGLANIMTKISCLILGSSLEPCAVISEPHALDIQAIVASFSGSDVAIVQASLQFSTTLTEAHPSKTNHKTRGHFL
jgi:hypothetical protein